MFSGGLGGILRESAKEWKSRLNGIDDSMVSTIGEKSAQLI
jgi:hypothetical protein